MNAVRWRQLDPSVIVIAGESKRSPPRRVTVLRGVRRSYRQCPRLLAAPAHRRAPLDGCANALEWQERSDPSERTENSVPVLKMSDFEIDKNHHASAVEREKPSYLHMRMALVSSVIALGVGCGGGPGAFNGAVDGHRLAVEDAVFAPVKDYQGGTIGVLLHLSDHPDLCALLGAHQWPRNATVLGFALYTITPDGHYLLPEKATFTVVSHSVSQPVGNVALGVFMMLDPSCTNTLSTLTGEAKTGTVDVNSIELEAGGSLKGSFDVTLGPQADKANGWFNASYCEASLLEASQCG